MVQKKVQRTINKSIADGPRFGSTRNLQAFLGRRCEMTMVVELMLRLSAALGCGFLIGLERQYRQRTTGLRTSALVATGSALFVLVATLTPKDSDPTRIAAQVVSGVGFLCAGVIIRDGLNIRGLNTAGTLWCASGVAVLAGSGYFLPAFLGCIIVLIANLLLRPIGHLINHHSKARGESGEVPVYYKLAVVRLSTQENHIRSLLLQGMNGSDLLLQALQSEDTKEISKVEVQEIRTRARSPWFQFGKLGHTLHIASVTVVLILPLTNQKEM
jgi:putative Mg2+ transporter-C (MgtC) family protein